MEEKRQISEEISGGGQQEETDVSLEELFAELDVILKAMDEPDLSLEDSFSLYERGIKTVRLCNEKLDMVEKRMLMIAHDGSEIPFEE